MERLNLAGFEPKSVAFTWEGEEYQLREASNESARAYRFGAAKNLKAKRDMETGKAQVEYTGGDVFAVQNKLVQDNLRVLVKDSKTGEGTWVPVDDQRFLKLSDRLLQHLLELLQEMSDLKSLNPKAADKAKAEDAKN